MISLLTTLLLASTALAVPTTRVTGQNIATNTATCNLTQIPNQDGATWHYNVHIGQPFIGGADCKTVHATINKAALDGVGGWTCKDDGVLNSRLQFTVGATSNRFTNANVNDRLAEAYPMVEFKKQKLCIMPGAEDEYIR